VSNGVDFQHLRTLHGIPAVFPSPIGWRSTADGIEFRVESRHHLQHGRISGTKRPSPSICASPAQDMFMMFCGAPDRSRQLIGLPRGSECQRTL